MIQGRFFITTAIITFADDKKNNFHHDDFESVTAKR